MTGTPRRIAQISGQVTLETRGRPQISSAAASPSPSTPWSTVRPSERVRRVSGPPAGRGGAGRRAHGRSSKMSVAMPEPFGSRRVDEPLPAEHEVVERSGDPEEGGERPVRTGLGTRLGGVGAHGSPLRGGIPAHVDAVGDLLARAEGAVEALAVELRREAVDLRGEVDGPGDGVAGDRGLQDPRGPGQRGGAGPDLVHLDVVAVSVAAVAVVGQQHVGVFVTQDRREPLSRLVDVGAHEPHPPRWVRVELADHPAVGIPEPLHPRHAQGAGALVELGETSLAQAPIGGERVRGEAEVAVGGHHDDHTVTLCCRARHGPRGEERLVVGVGVESHQGVGHHEPSCRMAGSGP